MTPSATDHQVGRDKGVDAEGCDNISRQLWPRTETRCQPPFGLSVGDGQQCP